MLRRLGCSVVQAYRNVHAGVTEAQMVEAIRAGEMPCDSLHGVFGEEFDPSAPLEEARLSAVETYKREGDLALRLGGPLVVVHCSTIRHGGVPADERSRRVDQLRRSIDDLGRHGQRAGVTYAFENLPPYHPVGNDVAELAGILESVGAANTCMCLDTGHAHIAGQAATAPRAAGRQLGYVHLSDNGGLADDHELPTCGSVPWQAVTAGLRQARYSGTLMIEVFYTLERLRLAIEQGAAERLGELVRLCGAEHI
jgi:sugar phosphate isomerase/epimerase